MTKQTGSPRTQVMVAGEEHADVLAEFFRVVWDPGATAAGVLQGWKRDALQNPASGGQPAPTFLVAADGKCIGYVTTIPGMIWAGGKETQGYWLKGLMVLPEYRNGPVGFLLLKEAVRHLQGYLFGMAVAPAARKLFQALKFADLGPVPNRFVPLAAGTIAHRLDLDALNISGLPGWVSPLIRFSRRTGLDRLGGLAIGLLRSGYAGLASRGAGALEISTAGQRWEDEEVDRIWDRMRLRVPAGAVRNGAYLRWRYGQPDDQYGMVTARRAGQLVAIAAVKPPRKEADPRLKGIRVATLSEVVYDPADVSAGLAALIGAEQAAKETGAHGLLAGATGRPLLDLLKRRGYVSIPGNVHFLIRGPSPEVRPFSLEEWWVTRGDGESDGF